MTVWAPFERLSTRERRNVYLIKREFIRELDKGLGIIKRSISRLYSGLLTNIPSNVFYYMYFKGEVRRHVMEQINISLKIAIELDSPENSLEILINRYKDEYLAHDLISMHSKQDHLVFKELQEITLNNLHSRVPILNTLIHSTGSTYNELVRNAFSTREEIKRVLEVQMIFIDKWIDILVENKGILIGPRIVGVQLPIPVDLLFDLILEVYEYGLNRLEVKIESFFPLETEGDE